MTINTPGGAKKRRESTESENRQTAKMFLHDGFRTKQQHFSLSCAPAHRFFLSLKSHEAIQTAH